jgi:transcriptional regulator with XRE-family HTH domain
MKTYEILKWLRKLYGYSCLDIARQVNCCDSYISMIETGRRKVKFSILEAYTKLFNIEQSSILLLAEQYKTRQELADKFINFLKRQTIIYNYKKNIIDREKKNLDKL